MQVSEDFQVFCFIYQIFFVLLFGNVCFVVVLVWCFFIFLLIRYFFVSISFRLINVFGGSIVSRKGELVWKIFMCNIFVQLFNSAFALLNNVLLLIILCSEFSMNMVQVVFILIEKLFSVESVGFFLVVKVLVWFIMIQLVIISGIKIFND